MMNKQLFLFVYGLFLSTIAGILVGIFYALQNFLIEFFWHGNFSRPVINAIILVVIALVIIISRSLFGQLPQNFSHVLAEIKATGTANYQFVLLQMIIPAIILVSGTSLGPEATLLSSTVLYGIWISDKLRYVAQNFTSIKHKNIIQVLTILLVPNRFRVTKNNEPGNNNIFANYKITKLVYLGNGILWFTVIFILLKIPSIFIRIGNFQWNVDDLNWFIPLLVGSYLIGHLYLRGMIEIRKILQSRLYNEIQMVLFGGIAIYLASVFVPDLLFSGQHNFHLFTTTWADQSVVALIFVSLGKLLLLTICLNTGWIGGDIFPVMFAATVQGLAISKLIPNLDHTYVIVLISIGLASAILESPLLVGSLMITLFAPLNLIPIAAVATIVLMEIRSIQKRYTTYIPTVFDQIRY
ncbi:chloride channel protein [Paucilactobacillus kaifaensis]|uniref:chloride channel protein n=1 Tax=Paucilactobacillus kaifaensis TaxID=2559921 RepID=UPI001CC47292|nr:chloride channel protein [Paucilactobacillus kaifaensis]